MESNLDAMFSCDAANLAMIKDTASPGEMGKSVRYRLPVSMSSPPPARRSMNSHRQKPPENPRTVLLCAVARRSYDQRVQARCAPSLDPFFAGGGHVEKSVSDECSNLFPLRRRCHFDILGNMSSRIKAWATRFCSAASTYEELHLFRALRLRISFVQLSQLHQVKQH